MNENVAADAATTGFIAAIIFVIIIKHAFLLVLAAECCNACNDLPLGRLPDGIIHFSSPNLKKARKIQ